MPTRPSDVRALESLRGVVALHDGNQSAAARSLGLKRGFINRLLSNDARIIPSTRVKLNEALEKFETIQKNGEKVQTQLSMMDLAVQVSRLIAEAVERRATQTNQSGVEK